MSGRQIVVFEPYLGGSSPGADRVCMGRPLICCAGRAAWVQVERMLASMADAVGVRIVLAQPGIDSLDMKFLGLFGRVPNGVEQEHHMKDNTFVAQAGYVIPRDTTRLCRAACPEKVIGVSELYEDGTERLVTLS